MRYSIVSELPGRIRLRVRRHLINEDQARGIALELMKVPGAQLAQVHALAGTILLTYDPKSPSAKAALLASVVSLDVLQLPEASHFGLAPEHTALEIALENSRFQAEVGRLCASQLIRSLILPTPLAAALTLIRSASFIVKGLSCLLQGRICVEVLDAAALSAALYRGAFSEASAIGFLLRLSGLMEAHVESRTHLALRDGLVVRAESVWQVVDGQDRRIATADVEEGMILHLTAGSVLPVDGCVVEGSGSLDESSMTGESAPVRKEVGSTVYAGTALDEGDLRVRVTAKPGSARMDGIVDLVEQSSRLKAGVQSKAERLADTIVPYSFLAFFAIWVLSRRLTTAMSVLMVDYSCAIKLSTPIAVMSAMNEAARRGITVRGGKYLEAAAQADTVVFDKTGTLTHASPSVERIITCGSYTEDEVLRLAACIEEHFPHSVARAIVREAEARGLSHDDELHAEVRYVVAHGISTTVEGQSALVGSHHFLFEDEGVVFPAALQKTVEQAALASSIVYVAKNYELIGAVCIADPPREEAAAVLSALRSLGISQLFMLTGDAERCAAHVAELLGIDVWYAQVLPEGKSRYLEELRARGHTVMMVGDGINDSPALAAANVSVAMGDASDIARAVSDILIQDASLESLLTVRRLSSGVMERIRWDYRFIVAFNTALIAGGLVGLLSLTACAYLHNISTFAVAALNTRPLLRPKKPLRVVAAPVSTPIPKYAGNNG